MFAVGVVTKAVICTKLLFVLGYFIIRSELSSELSSEQLHLSGISLDPLITATDEELFDIAATIWAADKDSVKDVKYNTEVPHRTGQKFFTEVYENVWKRKKTYARLLALFDYYDRPTAFTGTNASRDQDLLDIKKVFIEEIFDTDPIQALYKWLVKKGPFGLTPETFKQDLYDYWFATYDRLGMLSSGFEHTFVGEIYMDRRFNPPKVTANGLHNWVRMYKEEKNSDLIFSGYIGGCKPSIVSIYFQWRHGSKIYSGPKRSSLFIGTSPEVQIALSTLCLLTRRGENCYINLDGNRLNLKTITTMVKGKETIYASYPICP